MRFRIIGPWSILTSCAVLAATTVAAQSHTPCNHPTHEHCRQHFNIPDDAPDWVRAELDCLDHVCGKGKALALRHLMGEDVEERDPVGSRLMRAAFADTDVLHYDLEIEIFPENASDPNAVHIKGVNRITIESKTLGLSEFTFRLREQYTITDANINGTPLSVSTESITTRIATLDRAYNTGEVFTIEIAYEGPHRNLGLGSIVFTTHGDPPTPVVYTLSQPYYAYTWWPCKDGDVFLPGDNTDKATLEIAITTPDYMRGVANGLLVDDHPVAPDRHRWAWAHNYQIPTYLVAFGATNYNTWTVDYVHDDGSMPVEFNIYPSSDTPSNREKWERVLPMLDVFTDAFGPYPFLDEKYGIYQFSFGGGMEHQTNSGQGTFIEWISAHELGHQWWGDSVTCRTWSDIWLNEGLAVYSEALWRERKPGSAGLPELHAWMQNRYPQGNWDLSVYVYDTSSTSRIFNGNTTYDKGGWVFHMLRYVLGDDTFFDVLAAYRAAFAGGAATTDDFRGIAESVSGRDLSWFFEQWVYGAGAPIYLVGWEAVNINGQDYLRLRINQPDLTTVQYGVFTMPLEIELQSASGTERISVWNDEADEYFVVPVSDEPVAVAANPDNWVLDLDGPFTASIADAPPALVATGPAPNAVIPIASAPQEITLDFIEPVVLTSGALVLEDTFGAPVPFSIEQADERVTLRAAGPLGPGRYTVTITDDITDADGHALDGEIFAATLPSGEGLPGGDAVFSFSIGCRSDLTADGVVDASDLNILLSQWGTSDPLADLDSNGIVDSADLNILLSEWDAGC